MPNWKLYVGGYSLNSFFFVVAPRLIPPTAGAGTLLTAGATPAAGSLPPPGPKIARTILTQSRLAASKKERGTASAAFWALLASDRVVD